MASRAATLPSPPRPAVLRRRIPIACAAAAAAIALTAAVATRAAADIGAIMMAGPAFVALDDVDRIANRMNFGSLSPGIDGGVTIRFGNLDRRWSGEAGLAAFWSRRRTRETFVDQDGLLVDARDTFRVTAIGLPVGAAYSIRRGAALLTAAAGIGYYVATVSVDTDVQGSNEFIGDANGGERTADGAGLHVRLGYERPTRIGNIGGGVLVRHAKLTSDPVRGAFDFDVDLSGVAVYLTLSVRQVKE